MSDIHHESLIILSSAVNTRFGVFDASKRFEQTLNTCASIKQYAPKCRIALLESGAESLTESQVNRLLNYDVDVHHYTNHADVINISKIENHDIVKNVVETIVFSDFYKKMFEQNLPYKRVFKLSSRYMLNAEFDYDYHMAAKGKIVIKGPYTSQFAPEITGGAKYQYMARLYSFDYKLLPYIMCVYENSLENMIQRINNRGYIDIEHCLFKYIRGHVDALSEQKIGVEGTLAPIGKDVSE